MASFSIRLPDCVIGLRVGPRGQTIFMTRETTKIERAQEEDRERALPRLQRREKLGTDFEKAVEGADGLLRLCNMILASLARRENEVYNQYHTNQELSRKRTEELEKFRTETEGVLRTLMDDSKDPPWHDV